MAQPEKQNLLIWGTCTTRDAFPRNEGPERHIDYVAQSTLAALPACPVSEFDALIEAQPNPPFDRKCTLEGAHAHPGFRERLARADIFVLDLIYENRGFMVKKSTYNLVPYSYVMENIEQPLKKAGYRTYRAILGPTRKLYFTSGLKMLADMLKGFDGPVVLNEVYAAKRFDDGSKPRYRTRLMNGNLKKLYAMFKQEIIPDLVVTYDESQLIARKHGHQWGRGSYHFIDSFYDILPQQLETHFGFRI